MGKQLAFISACFRLIFSSALALASFCFAGTNPALQSLPPDAIRFDFSPPFLEKFQNQAEKEQVALTIPRIAHAPAIDGKILPEEWANAATFELQKASQPTKFKLMYDDNAIYIAAECRVPAVQALQSVPEKPPARDDKDIWVEDHLEIWFQPAGKDNKKYQFAVSDLGGIADLLVVQSKDDFSYNPDWPHAVGRNEYGWTAEMAIPKSALGLEQNPPRLSGTPPVEGTFQKNPLLGGVRGAGGGSDAEHTNLWPSQIGFNIGRDGPHVKVCSWSGNWGDTSQKIKLEGAGKDEPKSSGVSEYRSPGVSEALKVKVERPYARAGDRWIEIEVGINLETGRPRPESERHEVMAAPKSLDNLLLTAEVFVPGNDKPVAQGAFNPPRATGKVLVDLRTLNLKEARLVLKLSEGDKEIGAKEINLSARDPEQPLKAGDKIKILIDVPEGITNVVNWPVMIGVPFPAGALWHAEQVRLVNQNGKEIPSQKEVTGLWAPEGAIQWLRFDALVTPKDGCFVEILPTPSQKGHPSKEGNLETIPSKGGAGVGSLKLTEQDGKITIDTGVSKYMLGKGSSPIQEIWLGKKKIATCEKTRGLYVVDQTGKCGSAAAEEESMVVEARGPVASCVRFEGWYKTEKSESLARHITRVECFAGQPFAKITHTLVLSQSTTNLWFKDIGWEFAVTPGADPQALFGVSRSDFQKSYSVPLNTDTPTRRNADTSSAYMLQDSHYLFAHGSNHFLVAKSSDKSDTVIEGEECGDWSVLAGAKGGLMMACKETARQHPKEFEVSSGKITLHLFSNRAGEELDFRASTLVKKWDVPNWFKAVHDSSYYRNVDIAKSVEAVRKHDSNAIGWSKTHKLMILPMASGDGAAVAARCAWLNSHMVYALANPDWIYKSDVLGPLHPKDKQRFPEAERLIDDTFKVWEQRIEDWGDFGFIDYFAGPHLEYWGKIVRPYRYSSKGLYTLHSDLWRIYARSGERRIREFAEETTLGWGDTIIAHWGDGNRKIKGLFWWLGSGEDLGEDKRCLPFYWEGISALDIADHSNLENFTFLYHLTGYRRARDIVQEYAEAVKQCWTPDGAKWGGAPMMLMRLCVQAYEFTWDPALRELAEATTDIFSDPEGPLGLSNDRPYGALYKMSIDVFGCLDAWRILGSPRYHDFCMQICRYCWLSGWSGSPIGYEMTIGTLGSFLYHETGDPVYAEILTLKTREAAACRHPETGTPTTAGGGELQACESSFPFEGIPYTEDLMLRTGADKKSVASWVAYDSVGYSGSIVVWKPKNQKLEIDLKLPDSTGGGVRVQPVKQGKNSGPEITIETDKFNQAVSIDISKDAPEGAYEIFTAGAGSRIAAAHAKVPMVIHAPEYWKPEPAQLPPIKWYFSVPTNTSDAQIFFEGKTKLYDPDGKLWWANQTNETLQGLPGEANQAKTGWIDLPADKPGLWALEPVLIGLIKVRNIPPFFAARDPENYFMPEIAWKREAPARPVEKPAPGTLYVPGAIHTPGNQALYLEGAKTFTLDGGLPHPSGDLPGVATNAKTGGTQFLPFKQGTIEFFVKPLWGTFDQSRGGISVTMNVAANQQPWRLDYGKNYYGFTMLGILQLNNGRLEIWHPVIIQAGEWMHVAWVWGEVETITGDSKGKPVKKFVAPVYINGKRGGGENVPHTTVGSWPANMPKNLILGGGETAFDELRVSDNMRYTQDFTPPDKEFTVDEHTRALFHFNGNCQGESYGQSTPVNGVLK